MFPPQKQPMPPGAGPMGGQPPPPTAGGMGGAMPQGAPPMPPSSPPNMMAAAPSQPAVPPGMQRPMTPEQIQAMDVIQQNLAPEELQVVKQCLTPELVAVVVKLFGPQVSMLLDPLLAVANSQEMMDMGDGIGGIDMDQDDDANGGSYMGGGSVSSPLRNIVM